MKKVDVYMTPAITKSSVSGKTYIVAGKWIEVPDGTTLEDVYKYVNHVKPTGTSTVDSWEVEGSRGNTYTIRRLESGELSCSCPGFGWRRKCKHTAAAAIYEKEAVA